MRTSAMSALWEVALQVGQGNCGILWNQEDFNQIVLTGMSTAIRLKQLANEAGDEVSVGSLIIIWSLFYLSANFDGF